MPASVESAASGCQVPVEWLAIPDPDMADPVASLGLDTAADPGQVAVVGHLEQLDGLPQGEKSGSVATLPAAKRLAGQSRQEGAVNLDQVRLGVLEDLDQANQEDVANLDRVRQGVLEDLDPGDRVCQESRERRAHRSNTKFQHVLMPYAFICLGLEDFA